MCSQHLYNVLVPKWPTSCPTNVTSSDYVFFISLIEFLYLFDLWWLLMARQYKKKCMEVMLDVQETSLCDLHVFDWLFLCYIVS